MEKIQILLQVQPVQRENRCGLCASTCPDDAVILTSKPGGDLYEPPANTIETFLKIAEERNITM